MFGDILRRVSIRYTSLSCVIRFCLAFSLEKYDCVHVFLNFFLETRGKRGSFKFNITTTVFCVSGFVSFVVIPFEFLLVHWKILLRGMVFFFKFYLGDAINMILMN